MELQILNDLSWSVNLSVNDDFIYLGQKVIQTHLALCEKVIVP